MEETDERAIANTSDLNEELGQVDAAESYVVPSVKLLRRRLFLVHGD